MTRLPLVSTPREPLEEQWRFMAMFAETLFWDEGALPFSATTTMCIAGPGVNEALGC